MISAQAILQESEKNCLTAEHVQLDQLRVDHSLDQLAQRIS